MVSAERVLKFLARHKRIGIDTSILIYVVEDHPVYAAPLQPVFEWLERRRGHAVTSVVTMLEILVQPYRTADTDRVNQLYALLSTYPGLEWVSADLAIADRAVRLRAEHNLRTPDAIQAATAIGRGASGFLTNAAAFRRVTALDVLTLGAE